MSRGKRKWSEKSIAQMHDEGRGNGTLASYKPWIEVTDLSSKGRSRRAWSPKTNRTHHLLSDVEYELFLCLEWARNVVDIREQYPLDRDVTQEVARQLRIKHPCYPETHIPMVMTVDFLATKVCNGEKIQVGFDAKTATEAEDERSLEKLEITRSVLKLVDITHHLVYDTDLPKRKVMNLDWVRDSLVKDKEVEPRPGYWASMSSRMASELVHSKLGSESLAAFCHSFDARHGVEPGTGLRAARMLIFERVLSFDLDAADPASMPMSSFVVTAAPGRLRVVGGL